MLKKLLFTLSFIAFLVPFAFAQTGSITGTVTNEQGEPVPTANVLLVEIGRGAATNLQGEYTIENVNPGTYTLRVTFVGYKTFTDQVTIEAGQTLTEDVVLKSATVGLEELVVTGYGQEVGVESVTTSIASINTEEVEDVPIISAGELLQGRAAGVKVRAVSGQPGAGFIVEIRGEGSINAGSRPLYIVNGVQISFQSDNGVLSSYPLAFLDPDNIASFQVLKGAAATAIYGASGANGVVLIQTKTGSAGPTRIKLSVSRGFSEAAEPLELMNTQQWFEYFSRAIGNANGLPYTDPAVQQAVLNLIYSYDATLKGTAPDELPFTDWIDFINRRGTNAKYQLSFAGGNEQTTFYIAGSYSHTAGKIKASYGNNLSLNTSVTHRASDNFTLGLNLTLSKLEQRGTCEDGYFINCPSAAAVFNLPFSVPYRPDGSYSKGLRFPANNIAALLNERRRSSDIFHLLGNLTGTYNFSDALSLRVLGGMDYSNNRGRTYRSPVLTPAAGGTLFSNVQYNINFITNAVLNYRQTFNQKHNISGLLGAEYRNNFYRLLSVDAQGFPGTIFNVLGTAAQINDAGGFTQGFRKLGFFGSVKYNYDQRYYLQATARYDGSSRFGSENIYGFFPSVSGGWVISEEDFYNSDIVNFLKLRVGWGIAGNSQIGLYAARGLYAIGRNYAGVSALYPSQLANPVLTWEEAHSVNIGLDFGLFSGRVSGSVTVYQRRNTSLLLGQPLPGTSGYESRTRNIGTIRNRGIDFSFNSTNLTMGDFIWTSNFNISYFKNEIQELSPGLDVLNPGNFRPLKVGKSLSTVKWIRWAGVNPVDGRPMWYDADGGITYQPNFTDDAVFGPSLAPDVVGGFGNTFSYKGLSLNIFLQYQFGGYAIPQTAYFFAGVQITSTITGGLPRVLNKSWRKPGDIVPIPKPWITSSFPGTDYWGNGNHQFFSTDYIRLKNITLSYSLPASVTESINLTEVQVFVSGYNLKTWTNYIGYDPEVPGPFPQSSYPLGRRVSAGINVTF